jgi:hypothetical protein
MFTLFSLFPKLDPPYPIPPIPLPPKPAENTPPIPLPDPYF